MRIDNLVKMANQIGDFFESMPDAAEAREGIANHIKRFWDPRMRRALLATLDAGGEHGMHELVVEALRTQRALLEPAQAR